MSGTANEQQTENETKNENSGDATSQEQTSTSTEQLGEGGQKALEREREARKKAESEAKAQRKRADDLEAEKLSDQEKLELEAKQGREKAEEGTTKLREAKLLVALTEKGIAGAKAKAAVRLLDGVDFDADDEPTNLDDRIAAAKASFGEDIFAGAKPAAKQKSEEETLDLHQGPRGGGADPTEDEQFASFMNTNFPGVLPESAAT